MSRRTVNRASARLVDGFFSSLSAAGRALPSSTPSRHEVEHIKDLSYGPHGTANEFDIYRPLQSGNPRPVVLYIHGGGFRSLSKESHWIMGLIFARRGYVVVNINYRLAPEHPYPAAIEDTCTAWRWVLDHISSYGGDPNRIAVAGESAGANLVMALSVACCYPREEPWARAVFDAGMVPKVVAPACGLFQVSDMRRYLRAGHSNRFSQAVMDDCEDCYLPSAELRAKPGLADPVCIIEETAPVRPLPPAFLPVGGWDPLKEDNRRMTQALWDRGVDAMDRVYPREIHAFHALVFRKRSRQCWREMLDFVGARL